MTHSASPPAGLGLAMIGPALLAATSFAVRRHHHQAHAPGRRRRAHHDAVPRLHRRAAALCLAAGRHAAGAAHARDSGFRSASGSCSPATSIALFKAIELIEVPIAILTYFVYPLLTGLAAAATGLDKLSWRGAAAAIAAFLGLALMIGAHPGGVALAGIAFAVGAACCRVVILLLTRARLTGADPRLITWYSFLSATGFFILAALASRNWQPPQTALGWSAIVAASVFTTVAVFAVFVSTMRVGPFRTALFMNLGAAARHHRQRAVPGRGDHAAAGRGCRGDDRGAGGVSAAAVRASASSSRRRAVSD